MKILFVCRSLPTPPRNGVELPISELVQRLSVNHSIDVLVLGESEKDHVDFVERQSSLSQIACRYVQQSTPHKSSNALQELLLVKASFESSLLPDGVINDIQSARYDAIWVSPIGLSGALGKDFLLSTEALKCLGLNDLTSSLYGDRFIQAVRGRGNRGWKEVLRGIRWPLVRILERRILSNFDLIHVQTNNEQRKVVNAIGSHSDLTIVSQPNGVKTELLGCKYRGVDSSNIVFFTHLDVGRLRESEWFLSKVWPSIKARHPDATLSLVGTPPSGNLQNIVRNTLGVEALGYVPSLVTLYDNVAISVVPTTHSTGWINRIADSFSAAVPVVTCSGPISTIGEVVNGRHCMVEDKAESFSDAVCKLLEDSAMRKMMSEESRNFAIDNFPTWSDTVSNLEKALIREHNAKQETLNQKNQSSK